MPLQIPLRLSLLALVGSSVLLAACPRERDPADWRAPAGVSLDPPRAAPAAGGVMLPGELADETADTLPPMPGPEETSVVGERPGQP